MKFQSNSKQVEKLSDEEFTQMCLYVEDQFGLWDHDNDDTEDSSVIVDNLELAQESLKEVDNPADLLAMYSNTDLCDVLGTKPEVYAENLAKAIDSATEAMLQDFARTGLLGMFLAKKHSTIKFLKPILTEAKSKMEANKDSAQNLLTGSKTIGAKLSAVLNPVKSPYLPDYRDFDAMAAALDKLFKALKSVPKDLSSFNENSLASVLSGTPFAKGDKTKKAASGNSFVYTWLISSAAPAWAFDKNKPVAQRGWDVNKLIKACDTCLNLVSEMEDMESVVTSLKVSDVDKAKAKLYTKAVKFFVTEAGFLSRGVAAASRQSVSGFISRIGQKMAGEY